MLNLLQTEFTKLRRRKLVWLMLGTALIMPVLAMLLFGYRGDTNVEPAEFYRWSAFGATLFVILPVVLGVFSTMLMYNETRNDTLKELWMIPVSRLGYFFGKFFMVLFYSLSYMLVTAIGSAVLSIIPGYVAFQWDTIGFLFEKCLEIGALNACAMVPVLAAASIAKGYILPFCLTLVYAFSGFFLMTVNMYAHPICSTAAIVMRNGDIPGVTFSQPLNIVSAVICIVMWGTVSVVLAWFALRRK